MELGNRLHNYRAEQRIIDWARHNHNSEKTTITTAYSADGR